MITTISEKTLRRVGIANYYGEQFSWVAPQMSSTILLIFMFTPALANYLSISPAGIKSIGSGAAIYSLCESEGFIPVGGARKLLDASQYALSNDDAKKVRQQFETSLHERKIFSPLRNAWLDFPVSHASCQNAVKALPILLDRLDNP